ncbi:MAG TPA: hypothetical protein VM370_04070 [Candidatus Thermoplasmatota archaeon]|nr:hypothetical protein [Candidatus Thermoplasmatota archaeon]
MTSKRAILLEALDAWHAEGALDEDAWKFLRSRYQGAAPDPDLDGELAGGASAAPTTTARAPRRSFAADAMQFVGGLLVGAALVALTIYLDVGSAAQPYYLLALGVVLLGPAIFGALRHAPSGLVEAGLAGGLVPLAVAAGIAASQRDLLVPALVTAAALGITLLRRAEGASTLVAGAVYALGTASATLLQEGLFGGTQDPGARWAWLALLLVYVGILLVWRHKLWATIGLALLVAPIAGAFALVLDLGTFPSTTAELLMGAFLGALLVPGILLGSRGLVAGAAAGLTIDAIVFASDVGGPGTAVVLLLALGGLLVWQAELVRRYFRRAG